LTNQPGAEPAASRRSPQTNKGRFIDRIYATVAAVRRVKEKIDYWGRSSRPENQAALSLLGGEECSSSKEWDRKIYHIH
jgi:hypothetical protein